MAGKSASRTVLGVTRVLRHAASTCIIGTAGLDAPWIIRDDRRPRPRAGLRHGPGPAPPRAHAGPVPGRKDLDLCRTSSRGERADRRGAAAARERGDNCKREDEMTCARLAIAGGYIVPRFWRTGERCGCACLAALPCGKPVPIPDLVEDNAFRKTRYAERFVAPARSRATACPRRVTCSFCRILCMWFFTVAQLIARSRAISLFERPVPASVRISFSREVSAGSETRGSAVPSKSARRRNMAAALCAAQ